MAGHYQGQKFSVHQNEWDGIYSGFEPDDSRAWERLLVEGNYLVLITKNGNREWISINEVLSEGKISLKNSGNEEKPNELSIIKLSEKEYELELRIGNIKTKVNGKRKRISDYPLVQRGFHWINEYPYNR